MGEAEHRGWLPQFGKPAHQGTEALEVEKDGFIYRVKVTGTGRFYAKKIQTK